MTGRLTYPGAPFKMSETPPEIRRAPLLGEQNEEVYTGTLGLSEEDMIDLREHGIT
jgi:formyl-CoA transferase